MVEDSKEIKRAVEEHTDIVTKHFDKREDIIKYLENTQEKDDVVLLKGSRGMKLNEVADALEKTFKPEDVSKNTLYNNDDSDKLGKR